MANYLKMEKRNDALTLPKLVGRTSESSGRRVFRRETIAKFDPDRDSKAAKAPAGSTQPLRTA